MNLMIEQFHKLESMFAQFEIVEPPRRSKRKLFPSKFPKKEVIPLPMGIFSTIIVENITTPMRPSAMEHPSLAKWAPKNSHPYPPYAPWPCHS